MSVQHRSERGHESPSPTAPVTQVRAFRISEVDLDGGYREVRVEDELDLAVADQLRQRLDVAANDDVEIFVCLERCDFIDSTGIAAIVVAHRQLADKGRRLLICGPSHQVSRILTVTGLNDLVFASVEEALADGFGPDSRGGQSAAEARAETAP